MTYRPFSADRYPGHALRTAYTRGEIHATTYTDEDREDWCHPAHGSAEWYANIIEGNASDGYPWDDYTADMPDAIRGAVAAELTIRGLVPLATLVLA